MFRRLFQPGWRRSCSYRTFSTLPRSNSVNELRLMNSLTNKAEEVQGNSLTWYSCGPTVYDEAHLGHARTYVCQDILRRVLVDHFGRSVYYVMGITDVDDKIIDAANNRKAICQEDYLSFGREFERLFLNDMVRLNVRSPTAITRVSEHIPQIVTYIEKIMSNGYAYIADDHSGVYFDINAFGDAYGKLAPEKALDDDVSQLKSTKGKQNPRDFALWKSAKENEPFWESPWGKGRPGWHIECSAMAGHHFGSTLDIHSGGIDLCFPHHNNEIAQCEAHDLSSDWSKFFVHTGHLYIKGRKMSKSLKNFIPISELLQTYSADHFRFFCLQTHYRSNVHYSDDRMRDAMAIEKRFYNSLESLRDIVQNASNSSVKRWNTKSMQLHYQIIECRRLVSSAITNDLDTPAALSHLLSLLSTINGYTASQPLADIPSELICTAGHYMVQTLHLFGISDIPKQFCDFELQSTHVRESKEKNDFDAMDVMDSLVNFRSKVRQYALNNPKQHQELLTLCDDTRDILKSQFSVSIKDTTEETSRWTVEKKMYDSIDFSDTSQKTQKKNIENKFDLLPQDFFRCGEAYSGNFSDFDSEGFPLTSCDGQKVSPTKQKKLRKKFKKYIEAYNKFHGIDDKVV